MFVLQNGVKIDEKGIIKALNDSMSLHKYYFDAITGQVGFIDGEKKQLDKKPIDKNRYFEIPRISEKTKISWAKDFAQEFVVSENTFLANLFVKILKKGFFGDFLKLLEKTDFIYGWTQWEYDCINKKIEDWFETISVDIKDEWEFDCDCMACQAENFNQKYGRYPEPAELIEFIKTQKIN